MSEAISITVTTQEDVFNVTVTEEAPISVNFYDIAVPDPRVAQARIDAEEAADAALASQAIAEAAAITATEAVASIDTVVDPAVDAAVEAAIDALTTDDIEQGSTNKYYSDTLFDASLSGKTTDNLTQGSTNKYYSSALFNSSFSGKTTADLIELTNLYFTNARAKSAAVLNTTTGSETDQAPSVSATKSLVSTHAALTTSHGVAGSIVGTSDSQTLTNKTIVAASNTITTAASGNLTATELNAALAQLASLISSVGDLSVKTKTTAYTVLNSDGLVLADATSATFTLTLPTAVGITGRQIRLKKTDSSDNKVTIDGNSTETIDGALTFDLLVQNHSVSLVSDGANWFIV